MHLLFHVFQVYFLVGATFGVVATCELITIDHSSTWVEGLSKGIGLAFTWPALLLAIGLEMYQDA